MLFVNIAECDSMWMRVHVEDINTSIKYSMSKITENINTNIIYSMSKMF